MDGYRAQIKNILRARPHTTEMMDGDWIMLKMKVLAKAILIALILLQISCGIDGNGKDEYSAILSTLSAFKHGNRNSETFSVVDLDALTNDGFMSPGDYPYVRNQLKAGDWTIEQPSTRSISIKVKDAKNHCSVPAAIDTFAMLGVSECDYENHSLAITLSK